MVEAKIVRKTRRSQVALNLRSKLELTKTDPGLVLSFQNSPAAPDEYLDQRLGRDYLEYLKMQRDCEVRRCMTRLINSIIGRNVIVTPASDSRADKKAAAFFQDLIGYEKKSSPIRYERMNTALLRTGQIVGFSVLRIDWVNDVDLVLPRFEFVPQHRFIFCYPEPDRRDIPVATDENLDPQTEIVTVCGYELRLLTKRAPYTGERCPKGRFLVYTFDSESPWGMGLGYSTYPWWQVKREATTSLLMRSDLDGQPPAIGTHPANFKDDHPAVTQLERFLEGISPNNWARLPDGFAASIMDTIGKAGAEVQNSLITIANHEICKVILGEILYSEKASGSYAANISQVEDRESSLIDGYCNLLDEQLIEFWNQIHEYNRLPGDPAIVHRETRADERSHEAEKEKQEAKKARVDLDKALADLGIRIKPNAIAEIYGEEYVDTTAVQGTEENKQALVATLGVGGTQALISFLSSIQQLGMSKDNAIAALTGIFGVDAAVAEKIIPEPQQQDAGGQGAAPTSLENALSSALNNGNGQAQADGQQFSDRGIPQTTDFRAVIDRVISHGDLAIGLEYSPGQVRFPGTAHARKLRMGYGHLRGYVGSDKEALDIYIHPDFLGDEPPADSKLFQVDQLSLEDGDFDEHKLMLMPAGATEQQAVAAYTQEMSADHFGGCREITPADLEQYRKPKPQNFSQQCVPNYRMAPGISACIECSNAVDHGDGLRCGLYHFSVDPEFICDSYLMEGEEFGEESLEDAIHGALNLSFATSTSTSKKKNCTPGKSHFCQRPGGKGSCISINRQCRYKPDGAAKEVADYVGEKASKKGDQTSDPQPVTYTEFIALGEADFAKAEQKLKNALKGNKAYQKAKADHDLLLQDLDDPAATVSMDRLRKVSNAFQSEDRKRREKAIAAMDVYRNTLISRGLPEVEAEKLKDGKSFTAKAEAFIDEPILLGMVKEFYQITGGKGASTLGYFDATESRAFANKARRMINIGYSLSNPDYDYKPIIWHEMGHHIEFEDRKVSEAAKDWVLSRASGSQKKLNEIVPGVGYTDSEVAYPDKFISPYVGKIYKTGDTEVISMGVERFVSAKDMIDFYTKDREHFLFTIGVLRSKRGG